MKTLYLLVIVGVIFTFSLKVSAQNIQTSAIEWHCNSTFVAQPGIITEELTRVVNSQESITWYDNNGTVRQTLTIVNANGSWSNVTHDGTIAFSVTSGDDSGVVQFTKTGGATMIRIQFIGVPESQTYELTVSSLNTL
ncbi:MAG TPA: hypothetical protein VK508_06690 [Cyclobacteriaceae bacterium]|nr:hypothetical protein [Cyclobacteriaceae bacterium]